MSEAAAFTTDILYAPLMTVLRASGLVVSAPLVGAKTVPTQVRVVVALAMSAWALGAAPAAVDVAVPGAGQWWQHGAMQAVYGLLAGFAARAALEAAYMAGHVNGSAMGFTMNATTDPLGGHDSATLSQLQGTLALGLAVGLGMHRELFAWLARSLVKYPPGAPVPAGEELRLVVETILASLTLGVQLAVPTLAAVMCSQIVLALMGRTAAQLNLSNIGFTASVTAGGLALHLGADTVLQRTAALVVDSLSR